jgi:hypothetical protein
MRSIRRRSGDAESRKDLTDEFKRKMLYDNPVRFCRFSEGDIAAARKANGS